MENENSLHNAHLLELTTDNKLVYILSDFETMYKWLGIFLYKYQYMPFFYIL